MSRLAAALALAAALVGCEFADTHPRLLDGSAGVDGPRPMDTRPADALATDLRGADSAPPRDGPGGSDTGPAGPMDARPETTVDLRPDATGGTPDVLVDTGPPPSDAPPADMAGADPEPGKLAGMTRLHNQLRAQVSVAGMAWDPALASIAQAWAEGCRFQHSGRDGVGENLAANAPPGNTAAQAFQTWADEKPFYTYASNSCASGKACGHYTQVVWRNTTRLGCGVATCTTGSPFTGFPRWELWVCNYAPPGNFNGERPY